MKPIGCPETSVSKQPTPRNIPEVPRHQLRRGGSIKYPISRLVKELRCEHTHTDTCSQQADGTGLTLVTINNVPSCLCVCVCVWEVPSSIVLAYRLFSLIIFRLFLRLSADIPLQYLRLRPSPSSFPSVLYSLIILLFCADSTLSNELSRLIKAVYICICRPRWLECSPLDPRFAGSIPTEVDEFLRVIKIRSTTSFGPMS
jgi:hypothetical protein